MCSEVHAPNVCCILFVELRKGNAGVAVSEFNIQCLRWLCACKIPRSHQVDALEEIHANSSFYHRHSSADFCQAVGAFHHGRCYSQVQNNLWEERAVVRMCCTDAELGLSAISLVLLGKTWKWAALEAKIPCGCLLGLSSFVPLPSGFVERQKTE